MMVNDFSLEDAEKLFKLYGCSHFHMAREEPELYSKYRKLNVKKKNEVLWTRAAFFVLIDKIRSSSTRKEDLWGLYTQAVTYTEYLKTLSQLRALDEISQLLLEILPIEDSIMCAESILDRRNISQKCSIIFISDSLKDKSLVKSFIQHSENFLAIYPKDRDASRLERAYKRLELTKSMLALPSSKKSTDKKQNFWNWFLR